MAEDGIHITWTRQKGFCVEVWKDGERVFWDDGYWTREAAIKAARNATTHEIIPLDARR